MTTQNTDALAREHEVRIQAIIKTVTGQRDAANNATVNALAEKAVVESKLIASIEQNTILITDNASLRHQLSELRIVCANLQNQLTSLTPGTEDEDNEQKEDSPPADIDVKSDSSEEKPGLLTRAANAVTAILPSSN